MDAELIIHIGYPKTGTTWLQKHLFNNAAAGLATLPRDAVKAAFVTPRPFTFAAATARAALAPQMAAIRRRGLRPVISLERLVGSNAGGGFDSQAIADRLQATFPHARILIGLREQKRMLWSQYQQHVMGPKQETAALREYLFPPHWQQTQNIPTLFDWRFFEYHWLIDYYQQGFGREHVHVWPYEAFTQAPAAVIAGLVRFAGGAGVPEELPFAERENSGVSAATVAISRRVNRIAGRRTRFNPTVLIPLSSAGQRRLMSLWQGFDRRLPGRYKEWADRRYRQLIDDLVGTRFQPSNRQTAALTGLDLGQFGYDL